ncbi:MAG: SUKH-4 family immunity protein [Capnocytophaga sp.]|nr:SUKH-4 family immunity protein [Capnocytophaga sp.]
MLTFSTDDIRTLNEVGITAEIHPTSPQLMSFAQIKENLFAQLNDYPQMNFYFIRFPDEMVIMNRNGRSFQCFGRSYYGYLGLNEQKEVYLLPTNDDFTQEPFLWVNASLTQFVRCYSLLLSAVFALKGADTSTKEALFKAFDEAAHQAQTAIKQVDDSLLQEGSLWEQLIYLIEDGWWLTAYHQIYYIREKRFTYNE